MSGEKIRQPSRRVREKISPGGWIETFRGELPTFYKTASSGEIEKAVLWMTSMLDGASPDQKMVDLLAEEIDVINLDVAAQVSLLVCCRKFVSERSYERIYNKVLPFVLLNHTSEKAETLMSGLHPAEIRRR